VLRFETPFFLANLILVPVLALVFVMLLRWKRTTRARIGDPALVDQLTKNFSPKKFLLKFMMLLMAFALTAMGLANLQSPREAENVKRQGVDVMVALDVSRSMLARDIQPSRLERAKQLINRLIDRLQNDRIGLVVFAGRAYMQMPLTSDHGAAKIFVASASPESVPTQGTVIGEALALCGNAFEKKEKKFKTVILISDGEDHDERAAEEVKEMASNGVVLQTVGVGSNTGTQIIDPLTQQPRTDNKGNIILTRLNERELMDLATAGGGQYQLLADTDDAVDRLSTAINSMEQKSITDNEFIHYRSFFAWFLAAALILLMAEFLIPETRRAAA
jgi:Ca-activated chloride channel family protein